MRRKTNKPLDVGGNIKKFRELKGLTREEMAFNLNLSVSAYGNIERNKTDLTISRIQQIAKILEVEVMQVFDFDASLIFNVNRNENGLCANSNAEKYIYADEYREKYIQMLEKEIQRLEKIIG